MYTINKDNLNKTKETLYKSYCHLSEIHNEGIYLYILSLSIKPTDYKRLKKTIFSRNHSDEFARYGHSLLYLILWDILFHKEYDYNEAYLFRNEEHKDEVLGNVQFLYENTDNTEIRLIVHKVCKHWGMLRRIIFKKDIIALGSCKTEEDYVTYIETHSNIYPAYLRHCLDKLTELEYPHILELRSKYHSAIGGFGNPFERVETTMDIYDPGRLAKLMFNSFSKILRKWILTI